MVMEAMVRKSMIGTTTDNYEELGQGYEDMEQEDARGIYSNGLHYENKEDFDDYNYDNGDDEYYWIEK